MAEPGFEYRAYLILKSALPRASKLRGDHFSSNSPETSPSKHVIHIVWNGHLTRDSFTFGWVPFQGLPALGLTILGGQFLLGSRGFRLAMWPHFLRSLPFPVFGCD